MGEMSKSTKDNLRIAFHFPRMAAGGVEKMRITLAKELIKRGVGVDFVLCQARGEYMDQVPKEVRIHDLHAKRTRGSLIPLVRYLRETRPDVLISSLGPQNLVAVLAAKLAGCGTKVYVTQHNALSKQSSLRPTFQQRMIPLLYRWALPRATGVIAVSEGIADDISQRTGFPREAVNVIYNPAYKEPQSQENCEFSGTRYIVSVGRLVHQKGYDDLLHAFQKVSLEVPNLDCVIIGVGPLKTELEDLAAKLGVSQRVHFVGFRSNPSPYISSSLLLVMASRHEGFGNVLVEALSCGTKVVSTDCEYGPSEILDDGRYGKLVPVGDRKRLAQAIVESLSEDVEKDALISRAREFSSECVVDKYLSIVNGK